MSCHCPEFVGKNQNLPVHYVSISNLCSLSPQLS
uniref:Uncharacterized protein n=1 Tax=Rhizophora mucronata TaxID=61149 RepID=A0A2P2KFP5_RHIMU